MVTATNRRERFLDHGRVFVETPRLMTDSELAEVLAAFVAEIRPGSRGRPPSIRKSNPGPCVSFAAPRQQ
jgi:hypothetical protein